MTPSDKKLRELAERVTPVDWRFERHAPESQWAGNITAYFPRAENEIQQIVTITCQRKTTLAEAYGEFMEAACPKNILALLSEKEAAEASVAVLVEALRSHVMGTSYENNGKAAVRHCLNCDQTWSAFDEIERHAPTCVLANTDASAQSHLEYVRGLERENAELSSACAAHERAHRLAQGLLDKAEADLASLRVNVKAIPVNGPGACRHGKAFLTYCPECEAEARWNKSDEAQQVEQRCHPDGRKRFSALEADLAEARANARTLLSTLEYCPSCGSRDDDWFLCTKADCLVKSIRQSRSATSGDDDASV